MRCSSTGWPLLAIGKASLSAFVCQPTASTHFVSVSRVELATRGGDLEAISHGRRVSRAGTRVGKKKKARRSGRMSSSMCRLSMSQKANSPLYRIVTAFERLSGGERVGRPVIDFLCRCLVGALFKSRFLWQSRAVGRARRQQNKKRGEEEYMEA